MRPVPRDLAQLRLEAEAAAKDDDWARFTDLVERLRREDPAWWPHLWAPLAAITVQATGGDGSALLEEAVDGGFRQPDMLPLEPGEHMLDVRTRTPYGELAAQALAVTRR